MFISIRRRNTSWIPAFAGMTLRRPSGRKIQICSLRMTRRRHPRNLLSRIHSNCHSQLDWGSSVYFFSFSLLFPIQTRIQFFIYFIFLRK
jgi:hypothetical protein